jgi:hypothetical protein
MEQNRRMGVAPGGGGSTKGESVSGANDNLHPETVGE